MKTRSNEIVKISSNIMVFLLVCRLLLYVKIFSVNLLYSDQWDFYNTIFYNVPYWATFIYEHAPHRLGIGGIIDRFILEIFQMDTRFTSYLIVFIYLVSSILALKVKKNVLGENYPILNFIIPVLFLSSSFFETMILVPNPSHGPVPVLLILLIMYVSTSINSINYKLFIIHILLILSIYTGFTIYIGLIFSLVFLYQSWEFRKNKFLSFKLGMSFFLVLFYYVVFFHDYFFEPASSCFKFPHPNLMEYPKFIIYFNSYLLGYPDNFLVGMIMIVIMVIFLIYGFLKLRSNSIYKDNIYNHYIIGFILIIFYFIFLISTAIGRVCYGVKAAQSSRYIPYVVPSILIVLLLFFEMNFISKRTKKFIGFFILVFLLKIEILDKHNLPLLNINKILKEQWVTCYISTEDLDRCQYNYKVYPDNKMIIKKLKILKDKKWNFYKNN